MNPITAQIPRSAFHFCRISLTLLLWLALLLNSVSLVAIVFALLLASAILKVPRAPMIWIYQATVLKIWPTERYEFLDVSAMRFAHGMGATLALAVLVTMILSPDRGWRFLLLFCLIKTISAFGYCPASKLFACMRKGGCCALTRSPRC